VAKSSPSKDKSMQKTQKMPSSEAANSSDEQH
jgi:hypothetical protein